jgi:phage-related protein
MASTAVIFDIIGRDRASDKFDRVGNSADRAGGKMGKLGGILKGAAKAGIVGVGVASVVAAKGLWDMGKGAIEDAAGQKRLATALKNAAGATKGQVAATEDWISAQGKALGVADDDLRPALAQLAGATGNVHKAQKLASLAMDISASKGMSLATVSKALTNAENGRVAGLSKLGINTKNAEGKTISFEEAQRRLTKLHQGAAASAANTVEGKMGRLKLIMSETGETIGGKLIPVVSTMAEWFLNKGLPAIEKFGGWLGDNLPPVFDRLKQVIGSFTGDGSGKLSKFIGDVKKIFTDGVSIVQSLWRLFGDNIVAFTKGWISSVMQVLGGAFQVIRGIFQTFSALLKGDWRGAWDGIKLILRGAVNILVGLVRNLWTTVTFAFKNAGVALKAVMGGIWDGIKTVTRNGAGWLVDQVKAIPGRILGASKAFLNAGKGLIGKFWDGMKSIGSGAAGLAGDIFGSVARMLNGVIRGINGGIPDKIALKGAPDINLPDNPFPTIPGYATGTSSARRGLAWVGENGPELVNFRGGEQVRTHAASMAAMGGGDQRPLLIQFMLDGKLVEQSLIRHQRNANRPIQIKVAG